MRIALLAPFEETVPPAKYGGIELVVYNLAEELVKLGHDVTLFASGDSTTSARLIPGVKQALRMLPQTRNTRVSEAYTYSGLINVIKRIQRENFDLIHNHVGWPLFVLKQLINVPIITTLHNSLKDEYQRSFEERHMFSLYKHMPLVSISNSQRTAVPDLNYISTVYNGIDVDKFEFNAHPKDYLVFLGRLSPEKGPLQAIRVAKRSGHKLIMAGKINTFEEEYYRKKLLPLIDGDQIRFIGEVGHDDKVALLKDAKALISPLRWDEPFGLANVEAMACGTPVITSRRGAMPEIIINRKTGFLCKKVSEMTRRVSQLDRIDRAACRKHVEDNFSSRRMAEGYEAAYEKLVRAALRPATAVV